MKKKTDGLLLPNGGFLPFSGTNASGADSGDAGALATRSRMGGNFGNFLLPNPDIVLRKMGRSIDVYKKLLKNPIVAGLVRRRRAAVMALDRGLDVANYGGRGDVLESVNRVWGSLDLEAALRQTHRAVLFGYQPLEMMWAIEARQYNLTRIDAKPPEWFQFDGSNQLRLKVQGTLNGEACPREKYLLARQDATYENPYGEADLSLILWSVAFMEGGLRWYTKFVEKFGMPFLIGKLPRSAKDSEYDELADQLDAMIEDAVGVIPDDGSVTVLERKGGGSDSLHDNFLAYCRMEINVALVGTNSTTDANVTHASATAGTGVTDDIRDSDAGIVAATIQQAIDVYCELNYGIGPQDTPKYRLMEREKIDDTRAKRDNQLVAAGAKLTPGYFKRAYKFQDGDLDEAAMVAAPAKPGAPHADFNEGGDELDVEGIMDAYIDKILPAITRQMIEPLIAAIRQQADFDTVQAELAKLYPTMNDATLRKTLTNLEFALDTIGRLMIAEELLDA
jgi:phage gp29-like protein